MNGLLQSILEITNSDIVSLYHTDFHNSQCLVHHHTVSDPPRMQNLEMEQVVINDGNSAMVAALRQKTLILSAPRASKSSAREQQSSPFDSSVDTPRRHPTSYKTASVAAWPIMSSDRVVVGILLCNRRWSFDTTATALCNNQLCT